MLTEGQPFIDAQDELSVLQFMEKYGMPRRINDEIFIAMGKALDFIDPDKLSMTVVLTAMNRFINEADGSQTAFLDGNQPDRLCAPMKAHIEARGGEVRTSAPVKEILTNEDGSVKGLQMRDGEVITADKYVSAMPVDVFKRMTPTAWQKMPYFRQFDELEGIPVINLHMWFDRKLQNVDHLCFSRSPLLSVYADMSTTCKEYYDEEKSMIELVFAPCSPLAGGNTNWIAKSDEEIIDATMGELARLFPLEIANDPKWPATAKQGAGAQAKLRKYAVVKVPRSVYAAIPGRNKYRPSQETPISNLVLAGDWTSQKFLGSMEGAVLGGKLAAEVVVDLSLGQPTQPLKEIRPECAAGYPQPEPPTRTPIPTRTPNPGRSRRSAPSASPPPRPRQAPSLAFSHLLSPLLALSRVLSRCVAAAEAHTPKPPALVKGDGAIAFGGGAQLTTAARKLLQEVDAAQFDGETPAAPPPAEPVAA